MKTGISALAIWSVICLGLLGWSSYNSLQPTVVAGKGYELALWPGTYVVTKGPGIGRLEACEFFKFETSNNGVEYGMYVRGPVENCWNNNQYATASIELGASNTIEVKEGYAVRLIIEAQDGVVWTEQYPTFSTVAFRILSNLLIVFLMWSLVSLIISAGIRRK